MTRKQDYRQELDKLEQDTVFRLAEKIYDDRKEMGIPTVSPDTFANFYWAASHKVVQRTLGFIRSKAKPENDPWCCVLCGGQEIELRANIAPNDYLDRIDIESLFGGTTWCHDCNDHTDFVRRSYFLKLKSR